MSWDIFVQDIPMEAQSVQDIPADFEPQPLGTRTEVVRRIREVIPQTQFSNPSFGIFEGPDFSVEFNFGEDELVSAVGISVREGGAAAGLVADLLTRCGWRAFDPQSDTGIFDPSRAAESLAKWRAYRDRALSAD